MKIRISYTIDVDERYRRAIRSWSGEDGLATRQEVIDWHKLNGSSCDDDLAQELENKEARQLSPSL